MPDDRLAWHRGGACLFIVDLLRRGRTTCPREDMRRNTLRYCALRADWQPWRAIVSFHSPGR